MHWSRRGVPRVDGRVIPWIRVLAKFINDLRGDEHRPSGLPCVAHPSSDWSLMSTSKNNNGKRPAEAVDGKFTDAGKMLQPNWQNSCVQTLIQR